MTTSQAKMIDPTDDERKIWLMDHPDSTEDVPLVDISDYMAGKPGAELTVARELHDATANVGFFYLKGHGIPDELFQRMFAQSRRFFALPLEEKRRIPRVDNFGYVEMKEKPNEAANISLLKKTQPSLNESFIIGREWDPDDPDVKAGKMFRRLNVWPADLPGFKETLLEYHATMEGLGKRFLPLWALSLGLPRDYFEPFFKVPHCNLRLAHYPPQAEVGQGQYGLHPHTDNCLMTLLALANVPGLAVEMPSGHWRMVDHVPGAIVVNTGNLMLRWTNGRYKSTKHRVINQAGVDRYSYPVFFGPSFDAMIECLPTCQGPGDPPKFEPITYEGLRQWYYGFKNAY